MNAIELNLLPYTSSSEGSSISSEGKQSDQLLKNTAILLGAILILTISPLIVLLKNHINLAITEHTRYKSLSENISVERISITPPRAPILDRNGTPLTVNRPSYNLYLHIKDADNIQSILNIPELKSLLTNDDIDKLKDQKELTLLDIDKNTALILQQKQATNLFQVRKETVRYYPYPSASHAIGYTGLASPNDLKRDSTISLNDQIGKTGLERQYDKYLRGQKGVLLIERNSLGQIIATYESQEAGAKPGATLVTTLDLKLQESLSRALGQIIDKYNIKGGAAIIINPHNGEILAYVSYPTFDSNIFTQTKLSGQRAQLLNDPRLPLFDRVVLAQLPPGSTFKTIVAAALLEEHAITPNTRLLSSGTIRLSGGLLFQNFHRKSHGLINVKEALMVSSNVFFCRAILKIGIERFLPYAEKFGIGKPAGIDMPYEAKGRIPSPEEKIRLAKTIAPWLEPIWYPEGDTCNSAIGQGITLVTPVQLAKVVSIITNGGVPIAPHLGLKLIHNDGTEEPLNFPKGEPFLTPTTISTIQEGMYMSVNDPRGLLRNLSGLPITVAAKSGTAEFGKKDKNGYDNTHGWVIGFFPYQTPKLAFVVMLENGGTGIKAAQVVREFILNSYEYLSTHYLNK